MVAYTLMGESGREARQPGLHDEGVLLLKYPGQELVVADPRIVDGQVEIRALAGQGGCPGGRRVGNGAAWRSSRSQQASPAGPQ